ncbi:MAG: flagellar hook-associated protein 3 [Blastococcus sp.]|jgi:flagellar hook-associated protein 3 FlgL|nr:flagellar hook-associated protein 3 [Blastococcus sp.]
MRITQRSLALSSLRGLNSQLTAVTKLQNQLTSGKTISKPSDDPTGTNTSMVTRQAQAGNDQQARNISDGKTFLDATDSALQNMLDQVRRVRDLTVQALNTGASSAASDTAIAAEVNGVRQSLIGQANQVVQGRPIFGGVTTGTQAYTSAGVYVGVGGANGIAVQPVTRRVSDVENIRVDITGPEAFGDPASGKDLFAVVGNVAAHVGNGPALTQDLSDLDAVIAKLTTAAADIGTRATRMDTAASVNSAQGLTLQAKLTATEDVDLPKTIMELQMQQTGYQASLSATAKALPPSLVDFLR